MEAKSENKTTGIHHAVTARSIRKAWSSTALGRRQEAETVTQRGGKRARVLSFSVENQKVE
jgi:hypothetical protein